MVKRKFTVSALRLTVSLAMLGAILAQTIMPLAVKADVSDEMANLSQNQIAENQVSLKQAKSLMASTNLFVMPVDREMPDKVITKAVITAYTSTPGQTDDSPFIAASGKRVHDGMIAANGLPFGTRVKIPAVYGEKIFVVEDRMNSRYGYGRFDVWLDMSRDEARKFGVKRVDVEIFYPDTNLAKAGK